MGPFRGFQAYPQMNFIVFRDKADDAAVFDETLGVADRKDVPAFQISDNVSIRPISDRLINKIWQSLASAALAQRLITKSNT